MTTMQITQEHHEHTIVMRLSGRFDFCCYSSFLQEGEALLLTAGLQNLELDMAEVSYIDSSALGSLMLLRERALRHDIKITLCNPSKTVAELLAIANFEKLFTIRPLYSAKPD